MEPALAGWSNRYLGFILSGVALLRLPIGIPCSTSVLASMAGLRFLFFRTRCAPLLCNHLVQTCQKAENKEIPQFLIHFCPAGL